MTTLHPVVKKYTRLFGFCVDIVHYTYIVLYGTFSLGLFDNICNVIVSTEHCYTLLDNSFFQAFSTSFSSTDKFDENLDSSRKKISPNLSADENKAFKDL